MEKKHNYFYKITNTTNGKYYYGIHSTNNLDDGYMGSGHTLKKAIRKYGIENFTKEIIMNYLTREEAIIHEKLIVTLELVNLKECYNLVTGGENENVYSVESKERHRMACTGKKNGFYGKKHTKEAREVNSKKHIGVKRTKASIEKQSTSLKGRLQSAEHRKKISEGNRGKFKSPEHKEKLRLANVGKKHTEETKQKIRDSLLIKRPGSKKCIISGVMFDTLKKAGEFYNEHYTTIRYRINSKKEIWSEWKLLSEELT